MTSVPLDPESRRRINNLFHEALEQPPAERPAFVRHACADAPGIAAEVLSLLHAHEGAGRFLAEPISDHARRQALAAEAARRMVGRQIGQYRVDRVLGQGGMGVVYQAEDLRLGRTVALKAISADLTRDPSQRERLRREARAAAALAHSGIATVYALEEFEDDLFIAGEFVAGDTLREEIARGPVDARVVLATGIEMAQALSAASEAGIIHRDLKPENVMRTPSGRIKILDFGLARMRHLPPELANLTDGEAVFGTPAYMSPEQIRHESVDARADLFALGVLLYEMLTGVHPFAGADAPATIANILEKEPRPFRNPDLVPPAGGDVTAGLEGIIRTLLRKAPASRTASARDLAAALESLRLGDSRPIESSGRSTTPEALWWWKFHQLATIVFCALILVPAWMACWWFGGRLGLLMFLAGAVAVVTATTLRLHLWFAADSLPDEWNRQRVRSQPWLRAAEFLLVSVLVVAGLDVIDAHPATAILLANAGVVVLISRMIIEPATTRAAFGPASQNRSAN